MKNQKRRRSVTLVEMIIVMILIATITGALAYNYRGTLNRGRAFTTKQNISRLETIITLYLAENPGQEQVLRDSRAAVARVIKSSPLSPKNPDSLLVDGWGKPIKIDFSSDDPLETQVIITSDSLKNYEKA